MQRHYRWLTAATVADWRVNGCSPSPCDANGTGRIQPTDYFGAQGYDSPLGTCHDTTPTKRMQANCSGVSEELGCTGPRTLSTKGMLGGVTGGDGKLHGHVLFNGGLYDGTIADVACVNGCSVEFDHPCELRYPNEQPIVAYGMDGRAFYTWWTP